MKLALIIAAVLFGLARPAFLFVEFNHHIDASYQAFAHILVGVIAAAWWFTRERWMAVTFWSLTAVEVVCATIGALT